jgi:hypothetical protein
MSRYDWPTAGSAAEDKDDSAGRAAYNGRRNSGTADALARLLLRETAAASAAARRSGPRRPRAVANTDQLLWQPLGPTVLLGGQAEGAPRVTGRVNAICVHPDGLRAYAASANGGVWATTDGGKHWRSIAGLASTNIAGIKRPAHRNVCAALHVLWRDPPAGDPAASSELVFMGTGEPHLVRAGRPGNAEDGLGIFVADKPLSSVADDPWQREARHLVNDIVYGFAGSPDGSTVVAATQTGLYQRPAEPVATDAPWQLVAGMPVPPSDGNPATSDSDVCTAVLWTAGDPNSVNPANQRRPERLWVWIQGGINNGLWVRDATNLAAGFVRVNVDLPNSAYGYAAQRAVMAAAGPLPNFVWLLQDRSGGSTGLFRITNPKAADGAPKALAVEGVPNIFHGTGWYNLALAIHPVNDHRVVVAGNFFGTAKNNATDNDPTQNPDADILTTVDGAVRGFDAAILLDTVVPKVGAPTRLVYGTLPRAAKMIGVGVHPDVHALTFSNNGASLWTGCDGGIYRNDKPGSSVAGFHAVNEGLSISETNFLGASAVHEGDLMAGLQDNGVGARAGGSVWRVLIEADGGGVLREPHRPERWFAQYINGTWGSPAGRSTGGPLAWAPTVAADRQNAAESSAAPFYTQPAAIGHTRAGARIGQFLMGTSRPWYTDDFGTTWATLPTGTDARSAAGIWDMGQDQLGSPIYSCRWQDPDTAWLLTGNAIYKLSRTPGSHEPSGPGTWAQPALKVLDKNAPASTDEGKAKKHTPPTPNEPLALLRSSPHWLEIEPNFVPAVGVTPARSALYLGTVGHPDPAVTNVDTLWWYDGSTWMSTELLTRGNNGTPLPCPVTAILVDPTLPDEVWVGTTVGVVHGVRTPVAAPPPGGRSFIWNWTMLLNGLPEAPVEDLALYKDGTLRLLRAAIGARGVWELRLDNDNVPNLSYLRVHEGDLRHRSSARLLQGDGVTERPWHASPDIRPRLAPSTSLKGPVAGTPWSRTAPPDSATLRRFQAALRAGIGDPRIVANGRWDGYFSEVLRENGVPSTPVVPGPPVPPAPLLPLLPQSRVQIDPVEFGKHFTGANRKAEPWGPGLPTLADLIELTPPLNEGAATEASCSLPAKPWKVEVVVHQRGRKPRPGADVRVTLLWFMDPVAKNRMAFHEPARWAAIAGTWVAPVQAMLNSANGIGNSAALPAGWHYVMGTNASSRRVDLTGQTLDPLNAGVQSFDLNLAGLPKDRLVLLVAVVRAGADILLPNLPLRQLVLEHPSVAVRAVRIA